MIFDVLLTVILLLGPLLLGATILCTRQAHLPQRRYPSAPRVHTNVAPSESPLPVVAMDTSPKGSDVPPMEAPPTVKGQPQTIINGAVHSLSLTINNNALPQHDQAALSSMVEVLQALREDINKIRRQVSRELLWRQKTAQGPPFHGYQQNPGPGPWASSNFDHYDYGSDYGNDSGWGTDRHWVQDSGWGGQPAREDGNDEHAGEGEMFETQTTIQERADCNVAAIDLWRSGTEEGAAADRENRGNQSDVVPISESSRSSCSSLRQPGPPGIPPTTTYRAPTPRAAQSTPSTAPDYASAPTPSNLFSGAIGGDPSILDLDDDAPAPNPHAPEQFSAKGV